MFLMKRNRAGVTQEDSLGCGVACIAYILGITYKKALTLFETPSKAQNKGYTVKELANVLNKVSNTIYKTKYVGRSENLTILSETIIYCKKCPEFQFGHYLVKTSDGYMDPFINLKDASGDVTLAKSGFRKSIAEKVVLIVFPTKIDDTP